MQVNIYFGCDHALSHRLFDSCCARLATRAKECSGLRSSGCRLRVVKDRVKGHGSSGHSENLGVISRLLLGGFFEAADQGKKERLRITWRPPLLRAFGKNVEILNIAVSFVTLPARNLSQDARTFELGYEG
jgi:hypothetical protein